MTIICKNYNIKYFQIVFILFFGLSSCKKENEKAQNTLKTSAIQIPENMIWAESKTFLIGAKPTDQFAMKREKPARKVSVDGFYIDATEVTNKQFKAFVKDTNTLQLPSVNYYQDLDISKPILNPKGADKSYSPSNPYQIENVIKDRSFLCHESYCSSFRISAKMGVTIDSDSDHAGFRTVATPEMLALK